MKYPLLIAMLLLGVLAATMASTSASFNDTVTSSDNTYGTQSLSAPNLGAPSVSGAGASASVQLSWTDSGIANEWQVLRLSGACGAPSSVVTTVATTSHNDSPGAAGTYCYAVKGKFNNWLSANSNVRQVTIGAATPALSLTATPATADEGDVLNASASVTGGSSPTGTVTFNLYRPGQCGGTPAYTQVVTLASGSAATSPGFTSDDDGTWHWTASYSGDANNSAASVGCPGATVVVSPVAPPVGNVFLTNDAMTGTCGAQALSTTAPTSGNHQVNVGSTMTWAAPAGAFASIGSGNYSLYIKRFAASHNVDFVVRIGYCNGSAFVSLGSLDSAFNAGPGSSEFFTVPVGSAHTLTSGQRLAIQVTNDGTGMRHFNIALDGGTYFSGPVNP